MPYYKEGNLGRTWLSPTQQDVYGTETQDEQTPTTKSNKSSNIMLWIKANWIYIIIAIVIIILILWYIGKSNISAYKRSNYY